jgi:hypothetical protein
LNATPKAQRFSEIGQSLLTAINAPDDLKGSLVAARALRTCLKNAKTVYASQVHALWFQEAERLESEIWSISEAGNTEMAAPLSNTSASKVYRTFSAPVASTLNRAAADRVNAAMGAILAMAANTHQAIGVEICHAYKALHASGSSRSNRHEDWSKVVVEFPIDVAGAQAWADKTSEVGIQRFMLALGRALSGQPLAPTAITSPLRESQGTAGTCGREIDLADTKGRLTLTLESHSAPPQPSKENLVGWLRTRADQAGYLSRWGAEGHWYKQSTLELTEICGGVHSALAPGHMYRRFAFLACIPMTSSISAKVALAIELSPKPDLWLDVAGGRCRMYLTRLLDDDVAKVTSQDKLEHSQMVDMWLPAAAWIAGQDLLREQPSAKCVAELLLQDTSQRSTEEFLTKYRSWVSAIGPKSLHRAKDVRVARSLGSIHRMLCGDVTAAMLAGDLDEVAMGTLHYITLTRTFLHQQSDRTWQLVGLGPAAPLSEPDSLVGSGKGLTQEKLGAGLRLADQRASAARQTLRTTNNPRDFVAAWTDLVHIRLLLTITLSAGRGNHLERLTWAAVMGHPLLLMLADKDVNEYSKSRLVPITQFLRITLDEHARDLKAACARAPSLGLEIDLADARRFGRREPGHSCFYGATITVHEGIHQLQEVPIDRDNLQDLCQEIFGSELNVGRHTLISLCVQNAVDPPLIKALGGHQRGMAEVFSDGQWVAPADGLGLLACALDWILSPLYPRSISDAESGVLKLSEWKVRPPLTQCEESTSQGPYPRVLSIPFHEHSLMSIRLVDQIRILLGRGLGPDHAGAQLLANYLAIAWISLPDAERIWQIGGHPLAITDRSIAAVWSRVDCRASIRRPLVGSATAASHSYWKMKIRPGWLDTTQALANWLRLAFGQFSWAAKTEQVMLQLSCCMDSWLRIHVPPFLLTAASTKLSAPTASQASLNRLVAPPREQLEFSEEQLARIKPQTRGTARTRLQASPLSTSIAAVHKAADPAKTGGENWARMGKLREELLLLDTTDHLPAETFVDWASEEARKWKQTEGGRIKVRSLNTYTSPQVWRPCVLMMT